MTTMMMTMMMYIVLRCHDTRIRRHCAGHSRVTEISLSWQNASRRGSNHYAMYTIHQLCAIHDLADSDTVCWRLLDWYYTPSPIYDSMAWPGSTFRRTASQRQHLSAAIFDVLTPVDWLLDVPERINGDRSFGVQGPRLWNGLPAALYAPNISLEMFRNSLETFLFNVSLSNCVTVDEAHLLRCAILAL